MKPLEKLKEEFIETFIDDDIGYILFLGTMILGTMILGTMTGTFLVAIALIII